MPIKRPDTGLCRSCVHADACTFPRDPGRPVMQCDEFEGACAEEPACAGNAAREEPGATKAEPDAGCPRGLCRTCGKRESCTFPKPEGGVWHCEEYE